METIFENTTTRTTHVYELECPDAQKLENLLKGGEVSHPLGRRWTFEVALAACGDPSQSHLDPVEDKECRLVLSWIPLNVSGDVHNPHGPWSRLTVWEVHFSTKDDGRILWKKKGPIMYQTGHKDGQSFVHMDTSYWNSPDLTKKLILDDPAVKKDNGFNIQIIERETGTHGGSHEQWSCEVSEHLAKLLPVEANGDIIFKISHPESPDFYLYAWHHVLEVKGGMFYKAICNSKVKDKGEEKHVHFDTPPTPLSKAQKKKKKNESVEFTLKELFTDRADEFDPEEKKVEKEIAKYEHNHRHKRPIINVLHMKPDTLHNLLYYFYTGQVNLPVEGSPIHYGNCPEVSDPFELYRKAKKYQIKDLAQRTYMYLISTLTTSNICSRLLNLWVTSYPELKEAYISFLVDHFAVVQHLDEWINFEKFAWDPANPESDLHVQLLADISEKMNKEENEVLSAESL